MFVLWNIEQDNLDWRGERFNATGCASLRCKEILCDDSRVGRRNFFDSQKTFLRSTRLP